MLQNLFSSWLASCPQCASWTGTQLPSFVGDRTVSHTCLDMRHPSDGTLKWCFEGCCRLTGLPKLVGPQTGKRTLCSACPNKRSCSTCSRVLLSVWGQQFLLCQRPAHNFSPDRHFHDKLGRYIGSSVPESCNILCAHSSSSTDAPAVVQSPEANPSWPDQHPCSFPTSAEADCQDPWAAAGRWSSPWHSGQLSTLPDLVLHPASTP